MRKLVLILGAKSDIAKATAINFAKDGFDLLLVGRDVKSELKEFCQIITRKFEQKVFFYDLDILDSDAIKKFLVEIEIIPDGIISFVGLLGVQKRATNDPQYAQVILKSNFNAILPIFDYFANKYENQSEKFIIGVSSVSGMRGRKSNYYYGSAKAAFSVYLSGLRNRLSASKVNVMTVIPGYVDTKMTKNLHLSKWLTVSPEYVGEKIFIAYRKKKDILYVPKIWEMIMILIRLIPEGIFKRLNL